MLQSKCADVGFDWGWTTTGDTQEEILHDFAAHAQKDHGIKPSDIREELMSKIKETSTKLKTCRPDLYYPAIT